MSYKFKLIFSSSIVSKKLSKNSSKILEKPVFFDSVEVRQVIASIDNVIDAVKVVEKLENRKHGDSGMFGPFFHMDDE